LKEEYGAVDGGLVIRLLSYRMMKSPFCSGTVDNGLEYLIV
jgi:hypothetical protein